MAARPLLLIDGSDDNFELVRPMDADKLKSLCSQSGGQVKGDQAYVALRAN